MYTYIEVSCLIIIALATVVSAACVLIIAATVTKFSTIQNRMVSSVLSGARAREEK